jgi:hypothetical protein
LLLPLCHGRGREFESRRPRHFSHVTYVSGRSPNIVVPFLRNAQGRLWAPARLYTTRGELCSYTRQPTTKSPTSLNRNPGHAPCFYLSRSQVRMIPLLTNSLVFDCLNTKLLKSRETILHGFEFFDGVPLPSQDLAYDTKGIPGAV